jgi:tetratricopeptide (TPR) repeat protein
MQLKLFQWDLLEAGYGYKCLARLDFDQARGHFARVLAALPDHQAAGAGLGAVRYWEQVVQAHAEMQGESAVAFFWKRLGAFPFSSSEADRELRANLLRRLHASMEQAAVDYIRPDLCRGYLSLQLGDYVTAESQLRSLVESFPEEGLLYGYLADALWLQGRREIANGVYATALLLDPGQMGAYILCNHRLMAIIAEHGASMAPVYGFLHRVLPPGGARDRHRHRGNANLRGAPTSGAGPASPGSCGNDCGPQGLAGAGPRDVCRLSCIRADRLTGLSRRKQAGAERDACGEGNIHARSRRRTSRP